MRAIFTFMMIFGFMLLSFKSTAQYIKVASTSVTGRSNATANDYLTPAPPFPGPLIKDTDTCNMGAFIPGLFGNDYAAICFLHAKEDGSLPDFHRVSCYVGSRVRINGDYSSRVNIRFKNTSTTYSATDGHQAEVHDSLTFNINLQVDGVPPNTETIVYWMYTIFGGGNTSHEDALLKEDSVIVKNSMVVNSVNQFTNEFNFASPLGLPGWNEWKYRTGSFKVVPGQDFNFSVNSIIDLYLNEPAGPGGFGFGIDQNNGIFHGNIYFSVFPEFPEIPVDGESLMSLFSLDIGSDCEISDPQGDGDENFDPGDLYILDSNLFSPGPTTWGDDNVIFGHDPAPNPFPPFNPAPVASGIPPDVLRPVFFDLDGTDMVGFSLQGAPIGPGNPSFPWYDDPCIHEAEYCFLSFEDDTPEHYSGLAPSVPVNSYSPGMVAIYSENGIKNESGEYDLDPYPTGGVSMQFNINSETDFHSWLAPDPVYTNIDDDDVDALDIVPYYTNSGITPCSVWFFSCDHEAAYNHISLGTPYLDPATIYEVTPAGPIAVIDSTHHGLPTGSDIADFEFTWIWDFNQNRFGLALLFSVHPDDPLTLENETGGLNPEFLYYSFMDGVSQEFSSDPFADAIDGIATWKSSLNGTGGFPLPVWGTRTWTGNVNNNWDNALNWFPQGIPFDPEDVIIPLTVRKPVINASGMNCRSLLLEPGTDVILKSGSVFEIKGQ